MSIWSPLAENAIPKRYQAGQLVYLQSEDPTEFYYLVKGRVKSYISSPQGGERTLTLYKTGDLMGEASFFDQRPRVSSAVALTDCQIVAVSRARLDQVFAQHPELAFPMLQYLAKTVRLLSTHVDGLSFLPADRRLARLLVEHADENGTLRTTHEELGALAGVSRVTVSRVLSSFADRGWLETGYGNLQLLDCEALLRFSQETEE